MDIRGGQEDSRSDEQKESVDGLGEEEQAKGYKSHPGNQMDRIKDKTNRTFNCNFCNFNCIIQKTLQIPKPRSLKTVFPLLIQRHQDSSALLSPPQH